VPAGKLAIADARGATTDEIAELERAGVDAVLVGDAPPQI
jgi:indole-3-glycerol phosphate synthase